MIRETMDYADSKRQFDINGWYEVKKNPLSKVGVFPYLGRSIGAPEPDKIYYVLRPEEELSDPECIESFKLLPWIDDHVMLGARESGFTPAEEKGIHGVIGEEICFEGGILYGNIKVFSNALADLIEAGKRELSAGYRCFYEMASGVWNGIKYDAIQRNIRGNHVALVAEGRMGPQVAVLDHLMFTLDAKDIEKMADENVATEEKEMTLAEVVTELKRVMPQVAALQELVAKMSPAAVEVTGVGADDKEDDDKKDDKKDDEKGKEAMDAKELKVALDAAVKQIGALSERVEALGAGSTKAVLSEVAKRNALAEQISAHFGTFDHAEMSLTEVAVYGVEKLGLKAEKGQEQAVLSGFLHNRPVPHQSTTLGFDAANTASGAGEVASYIDGKKE